MSRIEIGKIDTSEARENLDKLLEENKNYFLHASWGSGKTEFLKSGKKKSRKKLVYLDLWRVKDESTVANTTFRLLYKYNAIIFKILFIICIMISILMTDIVNLGIEKKMLDFGIPSNALSGVILCASLVALFVAVWQFLKIKSDSFYIKMLAICNWTKCSQKVLVVDDFDRVDIAKQIESYKVFNILSGRIPIIFVGDYFKIAKQEDNYSQKIIDRQIELPYVLHPQCIWDSYFDMLQKNFNFKIDDSFKSLFISENRNLREQYHFNDYVNLEFLEKEKLDRVQINQQLLIIYLYLFHKEYYHKLQDEWFPTHNLPKDDKERRKVVGILDNAIFDNEVEKVIDYVLSSNNEYPSDFLRFKQRYYLFEEASNLSLKEIDLILDNTDMLKEEIELHGNYSDDFYRYVSFLFEVNREDNDDKIKESKEKIIKSSFELLKVNKVSLLISLVLDKMFVEYINYRKPEDDDTFLSINFFESHENYDLDISQKIYFFTKVFTRTPYKDIKEYFAEGIENALKENELYESQNKKPYLLNINVLDSNGSWIYPKKWSENVKEKVNDLLDEDFITFWEIYRIIRINYGSCKDNLYTDIKSIVVIHGMYGQEVYREEDKSYKEIIDLFNERLLSIAEKEDWKIYKVVDAKTQKKYI
ncbi:P-loop NTPase fold protein [Brochothrix thermosphacta]|uniref:P-loop NTPase fold protein n=1 Tax=Brochothrix thermosphacta TaxID=2756 RepID=UPI0013C50438|nr:P-loop NTPase fold protein [Brochothrix thermosphacta]